jgi:uncharacterized protein DUF4349
MKPLSKKRPFVVATLAMIVSAMVFWRDVARIRSGFSGGGSGAIAAFGAPKTVFPIAPLYQTSLFALPQVSADPPRLPPRVPAADPVFAAPRLIRTAELSVEVVRWEAAAERVGEIARELGGYVADVRAGRSEERWRGTLGIRVPSDRFDEAFRRLSRLGKTEAQNIGTQDVSRAYVDLEARIRVKKDAAERMRAVLRERAGKLSDIVEGEQELEKMVEALEQLEAQRRLLEQQTAFSAITLALTEPGSIKPVAKPSFLLPVSEAFRDSGAVLASSLAALIYTVVVGTPWALLAVLVWSLFRRLRERRRAAKLALPQPGAES